MKVGIQNNEMGQRGGINTYSQRVLKYLNELDDVEAVMFVENIRGVQPDIINVQYEPGMCNPMYLNMLLQKFNQPVVLTAHHTLGLEQFYPMLDGVILHNENQISKDNTPWDYKVIPHPALVFPKKDKKELRKKYGLSEDKKIVGTMGFICGTGKTLPATVEQILKRMKDDEFLYLITSFWKGGDMGRMNQIKNVVKRLKKEDNFLIHPDYIASEEELNERMQCCDLLYCWNNTTKDSPGSTSGSAADMYGSRVKLIVKDVPHFSFISKQDKVLIGRDSPIDFAKDVLKALRTEDLDDVQDPEWLSWEKQIHNYKEYFEELVI